MDKKSLLRGVRIGKGVLCVKENLSGEYIKRIFAFGMQRSLW
jgi:hypothetical protein